MTTNHAGADRDKWLNRIRALLTKAENNAATPAEAEAYTAKAMQLMAAYGIDQALIDAADPEKKLKPEVRTIRTPGPYVREKQELLAWIGQAFGCQAVLYVSDKRLTLVGFQSDLERTEILYTSLLVQQANALAQEYIPWGVHKAAYKRSWLHSYATAVYSRLTAAERRAQASATPGTDLVFAGRKEAVSSMFGEMFPNLRKGGKRQLSGSGERDGWRAGSRANLGGTSVTSTGAGRALASR